MAQRMGGMPVGRAHHRHYHSHGRGQYQVQSPIISHQMAPIDKDDPAAILFDTFCNANTFQVSTWTYVDWNAQNGI